MIRTIIIEDLEEHRKLLREMLTEHEDIDLIGEFENAEQGLKGIEQHAPDLIFLDVEMPPGLTGLQMLAQLPAAERDFGLIFTTMHNQYARQAIDMACLDYLDKPVDPEKLAIAIDKHRAVADKEFRAAQYAILDQNSSPQTFGKRPMLAIGGIEKGSKTNIIVEVRDIIYCTTASASRHYTQLHLANGQTLLSSKGLGHYIKLLQPHGLLQVHRSFFVNLEFARSFNGNELEMEMKNHSTEVNQLVPVSKGYKKILETYLLK